MSTLPPLALTVGIFLIGIGLIAAIAGSISGGGHVGHLLALVGMVAALAGVVAEGARPHRSNT
jgi:succinate-acetate transporter protein